MDPSIMKLLEEDEDESMHSGADVEAFQAALNRDIGGDASTSQPSDTGTALSHETNQTPSLPSANWQSTIQDENENAPSQQQQQQPQQQEQHSLVTELKQHESAGENQQLKNDVKQESSHLPLHQKQPQDTVQQSQAEQAPVQTPRTIRTQISETNTMPKSEPDKMQIPDTESQYMNVQNMGNQQTMGPEQPSNPKNQFKPIPFMLLLPTLKPHLDKDRDMQLEILFNKLRRNQVPKEQFVRLMRGIVGDQVLRLAVEQWQSQQGSRQSQLQSQAFGRQHNVRMPVSATASSAVQVLADSSYPPAEGNAHRPRGVEHLPDSHGMQASQFSSPSTSTLSQDRERSSISVPGHSKQQQQHLHFPQNSFSTYGSSSGTHHPYSGTNINTSGSSMKTQPHDLQMRQISHSTMASTQIGGSTPTLNMVHVSKFERPNSVSDPSRVQSGSMSQYNNKSALPQNSIPWQAPTNKEQTSPLFPSTNYVKQEPLEQATDQQQKPQLSNPQGLSAAPGEQGNAVPVNSKEDSLEKPSSKVGFSNPSTAVPSNSVSPSIAIQPDPNIQAGPRFPSGAASVGVNARTPTKKLSIGQKKPLEALGSSPPMSSKKQKVSGAFLDQSIEQLNDVTAVSGVNLREEEEQLFSGSKEDSRVSEASRRVVQEEEERLILQKTPLQKKLAEIMVKCGLKNINNDVERCLSLCVEERMRGLISTLIRLSKQRVDAEKSRHRTVITSDVRQQIMTMNQKAREEWERKQAEAEKLRKVNEPEGDNGVEGDKEKDDGRVKAIKGNIPANKEEDDKMRTTAANVAARAAVGGDDHLSKWQLMAEQARQKREGGIEAASGSYSAKEVTRKPQFTSGKSMKDNQEPEKRSPAAASRVRKVGRNQAFTPQSKVARSISVKDVIAALEREPQMSKSTLIYRLYERVQSDAPTE
ncbi:transcription initiation factor TFIID subunit 4b isoform X2 [Ricinus communis]|uniref:transcription initiation factor TFIID subunit 4b isoform X2 n=1 Tax=Ricinus communis TaxID=3988 RepID=UPI0007727BA9|nr:transcription initiation factor TFIID subunit 4b isoform X2 [Ricinus communis]|eukprot:XP_015576120.1 transcription initiation factor TFIID subunit 4b isoform X2 [Ricinus communis]